MASDRPLSVSQQGRPKTEPANRSATAIRLRPETHERLRAAAAERDVSQNWIIQRAIDYFLDRLIPVDETVLTRKEADRG